MGAIGSCDDKLAPHPGTQWAPMELGQVPESNRINSWRRFGEQEPFRPRPIVQAMFCMSDRQVQPNAACQDGASAEIIVLQDQEDDL
mmetsp:Transcript_136398/g.272051  ORF Transcript_136398/g.272051 Transcript_136398/m.272051 type:complete len:87 (+) Transcript_136398:75-335(+)